MTDCGCQPAKLETAEQRRTLWIALTLNAAMFIIEVIAGLGGNSTSLLADGIDMLTDATAYGIALVAIGRSNAFKVRAATISGVLLLFVGLGVIAEIARRINGGAEPHGTWMIAVACIALVVNVAVLRMMARHRDGEVHLRAAWIFTRADVVVNAAVIASGVAVLLTGIRYFDLIVGAAIGLYVLREAIEILRNATASAAVS
jgi:cation diffusion facilitator family transporter